MAYQSKAYCGFCKFFGKTFTDYHDDVCMNCEIRRIREGLDELENAAAWDHNHRYSLDSDEEVHNCAHCKHVIAFDTRYHTAAHFDEVSCNLDAERLDANECYPKHSILLICDKWERA